jgi:DNA-binding GntR family transcriptional regulator
MENSITTYQPLDYTDLTEQTYRILKDKILRRELQPGEQIAVPDVALALGVSRTPVTDALKRLASDGLVKIAPRRGTFVTELTAQDVAEIFDIRLMIELYAAEIIFEAGAADQFLEAVEAPMTCMEQAIAGEDFQDYETFTANDRDFHMALVKLSDNTRLIRTYTQLHVHTHGARVHYLDNENARQVQNEHQAIVEAFKRGSVDQAKAALRVHISAAKARILELLENRGGKL